MKIEVVPGVWSSPLDESVAEDIVGAMIIMAVRLGIAHIPCDYRVILSSQKNETWDGARGMSIAHCDKKRCDATIYIMREDEIINMISTVGHELVHVKQFITEGLDIDKSLYQGNTWQINEGEDIDIDSPWEREAYEMEPVLLDYYLQYLERNK